MSKFKLTAEVKEFFGIELFRIEALIDIPAIGVRKGDKGGWVEKEANLSQVSGDAWVSGNAWVYGDARVYGNAWVSGNAWVYGDARVYGNAWVYGNARVYGNAWVSGDAWVSGNAWVYGDARVYGNAWVSGNARVYGNAWVYGNARVSGDAQVYGNAQVCGDAWVYGDVICQASRSDGYSFTLVATLQGARIIAGCRYFSIDEARAHWTATRAGTQLGAESLALVDHLERMAVIRGLDKPVTADAAP
jgi:carbonic anhydrase/acetyltransferase-like protein (isoleucine patch superfamily)